MVKWQSQRSGCIQTIIPLYSSAASAVSTKIMQAKPVNHLCNVDCFCTYKVQINMGQTAACVFKTCMCATEGTVKLTTLCILPLQESKDVDANRKVLDEPPTELHRCMQQGSNTLHAAHALVVIG